jgi:hypothetical protein
LSAGKNVTKFLETALRLWKMPEIDFRPVTHRKPWRIIFESTTSKADPVRIASRCCFRELPRPRDSQKSLVRSQPYVADLLVLLNSTGDQFERG